jgi:rfaE bifunctional protein nucleotidyltransferase chain/domain
MLIFTNGCFDILHRGHVEYLQASRALGSKLIVGINSDASVKRIKGSDRPVNKQDDRAFMLQSLSCVDEVHIFDEDTPLRLIQELQPDVVTKGGDYNPEDVVGYGLTKVVILPYTSGYSTTGVINACSKKGLGPRTNLGRSYRLLREEPCFQDWWQIVDALPHEERRDMVHSVWGL